MIRLIYRKFRSMCRRLDKALNVPSKKEQWIAGLARTGIVQSDIHFTHLLPDEKNCRVGAGCIFESDISIWLADEPESTPELTLGNNVFIGRNSFLGSFYPVSVGDNVLIGAYCYIISANHRFDRRDIPIASQGYCGAAVIIGEGAWLGAHVVVLPGVTIGKGAIVGAGSVVTKSIPAYQVWAGVPAKFIRERPGT